MQATANGTVDTGIMLPGEDRHVATLAEHVAVHAMPLLAASNAQLLSITIASYDQAAPIAMCWHGAAAPSILRNALSTRQALRALADFERVGERLLVRLSSRWPAYAVPPAIGIVTDGGGVAFSPDYPSPLRPDWLALHRAGLCVPTMLLPFADHGAWIRLTGHKADDRLH